MRCFKIELSSPDAVAEVHQRFADGRMVRVKTRLRNLELELLATCFTKLANSVQSIPEYLACIKGAKVFQTIPETARTVSLTKDELEGLLKGFSLTVNNRPEHWVQLTNLIGQIDAPEQIDEPVTEVK